MTMIDLMMFRPFWAADAGAGAGDPPAGAADAGAGAGDPPAGAGDPPAGNGNWWEGKGFTDAHRTLLTTRGLTVDDPLDAVRNLADAYDNATRRLGKPADQLLDKPKDGTPLAEWRRENAALFGVPESPDGYEIAKPEDWPKDAPWDDALEAEARKIAHERGLSADDLQPLVTLFANSQKALMDSAATQLAEANVAMHAHLDKEWGQQKGAKMAAAKQAADMLAEQLGWNADQMAGLSQSLADKVGDAGVIQLFAQIADMAGDDKIVGLGNGGGFGTTPAEARQQLQAMDAKDSEYAKAVAAGDRTTIARLTPQRQALIKIIADADEAARQRA